MLDSKKNNTWVFDKDLCYYDKSNYCGVNKLVKGFPIVNKNLYKRRSLECRINLAKRFFRVGTLPDYSSVVEVENPNKIDPAESYRFTLAGLDSKAKMTILKLEKVKSFDSSMWWQACLLNYLNTNSFCFILVVEIQNALKNLKSG